MFTALLRRLMKPASSGLPRESFVVLEGESDGLPDIWIVNHALREFAPQSALPWHLSILIGIQEPTELGLPTAEEQKVLGTLGEQIREALKADGNAAFLASITCDGIRQLVFRVRDPEAANLYLQGLVGDDAIRPMEYRMEHDAEWALARPHFEHVDGP